MFFSISALITPPMVSIPNDSGVTSSRRTSVTSPAKTAAWIDAPKATASSGFTSFRASLPKNSFTFFCTKGIRVWPPTRIMSSILETLTSASFSATRSGSSVRSTSSSTRDSSLAWVTLITRCLGPVLSAVMYGRLTSVWPLVDSSILAFSAASFRRCNASGSLCKSIACSFLNSSARYSIRRRSKSSPPRKVSPLVDSTSNCFSPSTSAISMIEISKVPPPRS